MELIRTFTARNKRVTGTDINKLFQTIGEIRVQIDSLKVKIENVKKLHSEIVSSPTTEREKTEQLDNLNSEIKQCSISIRTKLKAIEKNILQQEAEEARKTKNLGKYVTTADTSQGESIQLVSDESGTPAKLRIHKMQYSTNMKMYTDIMNDYTESQIEYRDLCRYRLKRQLEIAATTYTEEQIENMIDEGNFTVFTQGLASETKDAKRDLADLKKRHTALKKLEKSIEALAEIFSDVAVQIEAQGEKITEIETKTEGTVAQVEVAVEETGAALKSKNAYRKKKLIMMLVVTGVVLVVILVVCLSVLT